MSLILLNLQSNQKIKLDNQNPLIIGRRNVAGVCINLLNSSQKCESFCFDKRVSRNHGRVTCTVDGKIRLEALHCNPCFFTRNGVPPVLQLNKDEEETLNEGDYLGLLPNDFWFKIVSNKETKIKTEPESSNTTRTDENVEENIRISALDKNGSIANYQVDKTVIVKEEDDLQLDNKGTENRLNPLPVPTTSDTKINSAGTSKGFGSVEFEKTKKLPLWMYEIYEPTKGNKTSNKRSAPISSEKEKKQKLLHETDVKTGTQAETENENLNFPSTSKVETVNKLPNSTPNLEDAVQVQEESSKESNSNKKEGYESDAGLEDDSPKRRPICQYEGNCYRQNPQHKSQFSHPGDSDFVAYEERPLCQYGASCYRRNEKHRVEFRHPQDSDSHNVSSSCSHNSIASSPLPSKRRRKKIKMQNSDYEDDEYDLEDPFINDATSDEYIPSDYEEEEEDLNTSRDDE